MTRGGAEQRLFCNSARPVRAGGLNEYVLGHGVRSFGDTGPQHTGQVSSDACGEFLTSAPAASGSNQTSGVAYECGEMGSNCYVRAADRDGRIPIPWKETNVIGFNLPLNGDDFFKQGGPLSQALNLFPGLNAIAQIHDTFFNTGPLPLNILTNIGTMLPAAYWTYGALVDSVHLCPRCTR